MTEWHAVEAIDEAMDRTKSMLFPIQRGLWLRLALIVLLAGWGLGGNGFNFNSGFPSGDRGESGLDNAQMGPEVITIILLVVALAVFIALVLGYIGAVMKFGFIKALLSGEAKVVDYLKEYAERGLYVFIFNLIVGIAFIASLVATGLLLYLMFGTSDSDIAKIGGILIFFIVFFAVLMIALVFFWLEDEFAIPLMYANNQGIVSAVKDTLKLTVDKFWQITIFSLLQFAFAMVGGIIAMIISLPLIIVFIAAVIFAAIVAAAALGLSSLADITMTPVVLAAIIVGVVLLIAISLAISYLIALVTLPITVFMRFYSLIFLQRIAPDIKLFPKALKEAPLAATSPQTIDLLSTQPEAKKQDDVKSVKPKARRVIPKAKAKRKIKK
jgi:hypothetical protein